MRPARCPARRYELKTTLGVVVAWGIVLWQQLPDPFLAPIAVLFLQTPYLVASLHKGLMRVLGTLVGALLVLVLLAFLIQDRWALIGALSAVVAVSIYMIRNSRYGDAWFMLAITAVIIAGDASLDPSMAFAKAVSRSTEAVVGILVVLVINGLLWPRNGGAIYDRVYCAMRSRGSPSRQTPADALSAARQCLGRLSADPGREPKAVAESALLHATAFALNELIARVEGLADAAVALPAGRSLPASALAAEVRAPLGERLARNIGVAGGLRTFAEALEAIDWAAWRLPRF